MKFSKCQINHWQQGGGHVTNAFHLRWKAGQQSQDFIMSQHRSLRAVATVGGKRNVLKRFERVGVLKKRGQWKDGDRITGLRKTKPDA
jgi:small basic protein (TIGR04137 family)